MDLFENKPFSLHFWIITVLILIYAFTHVASLSAKETSIDSQDTNLPNTKSLVEASPLAADPDYSRPADQARMELFGKPLIVGGKWQLELEDRRDYSLGTKADNQLNLQTELELEFLYLINKKLLAFVRFLTIYDSNLYKESGDKEQDIRLKRGQTWLFFQRIFDSPFSLQIGRQNFRDKREWWWDSELDSIRLSYDKPSWQAYVAVARELYPETLSDSDISPEQQDVDRLIGRFKWDFALKQRFELFYTQQWDNSTRHQENDVILSAGEDDEDGNLYWLGAHFDGRIKLPKGNRLYYWFDAGLVRGTITSYDYDNLPDRQSEVDDVFDRKVQAWSYDAGLTWKSPFIGKPSFTIGYAKGSGDANTDDDIDKSYHQTGLQDNSIKIQGVSRFQYYGELLKPELSNLSILIISAGVPLMSNSSIELLYHRYSQVEAAPSLRNSKLKISPNGLSTDLGEELDLVMGIEEWKQWKLDIIFGVYQAGQAFGDQSGKHAFTGAIEIEFAF